MIQKEPCQILSPAFPKAVRKLIVRCCGLSPASGEFQGVTTTRCSKPSKSHGSGIGMISGFDFGRSTDNAKHIPFPLADRMTRCGEQSQGFKAQKRNMALPPVTRAKEYELSQGASTERTEGHLTAAEILPVDIADLAESTVPS